MATRKAVAKSTETKTYIIESHRGEKRKVTVPASWKITYGLAAPGSHVSSPFVLRFYEGNKENLRALFEDVKSFRDSSLKVEVQIEKKQAEVFYKETSQGRREQQAEMTVREWRDADNPTSSSDIKFLNMPRPAVVDMTESDED